MKRTFLAKRNTFITSTNISWGASALALVCVVLFMRLFAPNFFWQVFSPIFRVADALAAESHGLISSFENAAALAAQNEQLTSSNAALALENQTLSQEIGSISALLDSSATARASLPGILAGVIARPPESPYDTLVLGAGSDEGITRGQEAFGPGGVPLGVVEEVTAHFSRLTLFSAPGMVINGWVGSKNLPLTIVGAGGGVLSASAARSAGIAVGDTVFVPGPGKLSIGVVSRSGGDPSSPGVTLRILPALNLFSVTWVVVRDTGVKLFGPLQTATSTLP